MEQLLCNLRAMQTAATAALVSLALIGLPLLAANDDSVTGLSNAYYAEHIIKLFQKTGAEVVGTFDNASVSSSGFDFAAYMSHTCFRPTEYDSAGCKREFGPYWNLNTTYHSGALNMILRGTSFLAGAAHLAPTQAVIKKVEEKEVEETNTNTTLFNTPSALEVRARSVKLWNACQAKESSREEMSRCYQRNIRRTQLWNPETDAVY